MFKCQSIGNLITNSKKYDIPYTNHFMRDFGQTIPIEIKFTITNINLD